MPFSRFVEVGRVALVNYGPDAGTLCCIIDIVDGNKCLVDGPDIARQMMSYKRMALTDVVLGIPKNARIKTLMKEWPNVDWEKTAWAKKLEAKKRRRDLTDFERFELMVARKQRATLIGEKLKVIQEAA